MQLLINIIFTSQLYLIVAFSFAIIYQTTNFFHLSHAAIITLGSYLTYYLFVKCSLPLWFSIFSAILISVFIAILIQQLVYKPLSNVKDKSLILLIVSLGVYVILENIISLIWGDGTLSMRTANVKIGYEVFGAYITKIQIITILVSFGLLIVEILILNRIKLGRQIKAVSSNSELTKIFGINSNKVILCSFVIGTTCAVIAGILTAFDTDMTPTMGFSILLYGIVAMIIGGVGSTWGLIGGSLLLATAQHLGAYYIDSKWMDAIAYIILILFLIWRPLGFSGKRLKKINI